MTDDVMTNAPEPTDDPNADIMNMLDFINASEYQKANDLFKDELEGRMSVALEQEKIAIAQGIGDEVDPSEEVTDEEIDAAVDTLMDDDDDDDHDDDQS